MSGPIRPNAPESFNRSAPAYDMKVSYNRDGARRLVAAIPDGRYPRLVDVACGTGFATLAAIPRLGVEHVTAVDASAPMLDVLRDRLAVEHPSVTATVHACDVLDMPVPDGSADLVLCTMALHWFTRRADAVARMARTLAPGGMLGILAPGPEHDTEGAAVVEATGDPVLWRLGQSMLSNEIDPDVLAGYLMDAGLEVVDVWTETRRRSLPPDAYTARNLAVASHLWADLPVPEQAVVADRLTALYRAAAGADGLFHYRFVKTYAVARTPG